MPTIRTIRRKFDRLGYKRPPRNISFALASILLIMVAIFLWGLTLWTAFNVTTDAIKEHGGMRNVIVNTGKEIREIVNEIKEN